MHISRHAKILLKENYLQFENVRRKNKSQLFKKPRVNLSEIFKIV
jgi:hypothetical protein